MTREERSSFLREQLIRNGTYTEEVMAKAEQIFYDTHPRGLTSPFQHWIETASAPTQSYFAKLARVALANEEKLKAEGEVTTLK
jgi:hypothetical protein